MLKKLILIIVLFLILNLDTVLAGCDYQLFLTLEPNIIIPGGSVTPSATICCDTLTKVYFSEDECNADSPVSSCTIIPEKGCSCLGASFSVPNEAGKHTYVACIDRNGNGIYGDIPEEIGTATLTVKGCIATDTSSKYPNGNNPFVKGTVTYPDEIYEDKCLDEKTLNESYCSSAGVKFDTTNCNQWVNMKCYDGKCYCVGDVNGDKKVDMKDLAMIAKSFGSDSTLNPKKYNVQADLNLDGKITMKDIAIAAARFGKNCNLIETKLGFDYNFVVILISGIVMVLFFGTFRILVKKKVTNKI